MEPNPSSEPVIDDNRCYICNESNGPINPVSWIPMSNVRITRHLCSKCADAFDNETHRIQTRKAYELHVAYNHWESVQRARYFFANRQHILPGV